MNQKMKWKEIIGRETNQFFAQIKTEFWQGLFCDLLKKHTSQDDFFLVPADLTNEEVVKHMRVTITEVSNKFGFRFIENTHPTRTEFLLRFPYIEKNRETIDDFSIVICIRDITLRILPHSPLLKLYWLEEYGCVENIVKDLCEELYNNNKLEQLHRDYKRVYDCSENLTQKTVEIAQNTIKGVYEAKQKINRSLVQKVLYSSMLINGQRVRIYHKDFLENPAVLTELFEK